MDTTPLQVIIKTANYLHQRGAPASMPGASLSQILLDPVVSQWWFSGYAFLRSDYNNGLVIVCLVDVIAVPSVAAHIWVRLRGN